jgi:hypothetical protein
MCAQTLKGRIKMNKGETERIVTLGLKSKVVWLEMRDFRKDNDGL